MRDLILVAVVAGVIPFILMRPWIGVLAWSWFSYMNPHRLTWGFAYSLPFAQLIAISLIVATLFSKEKKQFPINATTVIWIIFLAWMTLTSFLAIYPDLALNYLDRVLKIQLITFFTLMLITSKDRLDALIWVIALSIGFYSIKGGLFTVLTGGSYRVYGPAESMIAENNALGLATLMIIPLFVYLSTTVTNKWLKWGLYLAIFLSLASAVGSQSRGAFVALIVVAGYFWWQSKSKLFSGLALVIVMSIGFVFMPESWHDRMASIQNYEEDTSALTRLHAWEYSVNLANDRITGGGFNSWSKPTYEIYRPNYIGVFVAHSIYFSVIADHGWIGFFMFMAILILTWRNLTYVIRHARGDPQLNQLEMLGRMVKVSFVAYLSGGAFLSLSYFNLPWHLISVAVIARCLIERRQSEKAIELDMSTQTTKS